MVLSYTNVTTAFCQSDNFNERFFRNPGVYSILQAPPQGVPQVTTLAWIYHKNMYIEFHYNYEDRKTLSGYFGRSFMADKRRTLEIIPMVGFAIGRFTGIVPSTTFLLEKNNVRGFSQTQCLIRLNNTSNNSLFNWSEVVVRVYKLIYLGGSDLLSFPQNNEATVYIGPVLSIKMERFIFEGYAYNFWGGQRLWALGIQFTPKL